MLIDVPLHLIEAAVVEAQQLLAKQPRQTFGNNLKQPESSRDDTGTGNTAPRIKKPAASDAGDGRVDRQHHRIRDDKPKAPRWLHT